MRTSLVVQLVKNLPAMWKTWVWSQGWEDPLDEGKATHWSILAWRIPWTVQSVGSQRVGHDWATFTSVQFISVQLFSHVRLFAIPWTEAHQASLSITNSRSLLKLMSIELVMPSYHLFLCCPLLLLPSTFPSIRVYSNESVLHIRWPKYWNFSSIISPSSEYSGLISLRMDWLDLFVVQGTLKGLLKHHSSKASILQRSDFFIVQLSHDYWKNHSLD